MGKAICIIRTSTSRQHIEEQTAEVVQMAKADGFRDEDIEVIGKCGASAIKLDEAYMENLDRLYERLESGAAECVYAWAIDRIGRDEVTLFRLKQTLEKKKIQLKIKNPDLTLFNKIADTLTINPGVELAFSLYATMSKQEMMQKKERFARGKRQSGKAQRYTGGSIAFGYSVDGSGKYVINEEEASVVRKVYEMYLTGRYSLKSLTDEVRKRGITWRGGKAFTLARVRLIIYNTCYIGTSGGAGIQQFPRIISDELYYDVREILAKNKTGMSMESKHSYFANKLIKCQECGYSYSANGRLYRCVKHSNNRAWSMGKSGYTPCHNDVCISIEAMDGLLYRIARDSHRAFLEQDIERRNTFLQDEINGLAERKSGLEKSMENYALRRKRLYDGYAALVYTEDEYEARLQRLEDEYDGIRNEILDISERMERNRRMMGQDSKTGMAMAAVLTRGYMLEADEKDISDLVHMYVRRITLSRFTPEMQRDSMSFRMRERMAKEDGFSIKPDSQATLIDVEYTDGRRDRFVYYGRRKIWQHRFWKVDEYGLEMPFRAEAMKRDSRGCMNEELRQSAEIIRRAQAGEDVESMLLSFSMFHPGEWPAVRELVRRITDK